MYSLFGLLDMPVEHLNRKFSLMLFKPVFLLCEHKRKHLAEWQSRSLFHCIEKYAMVNADWGYQHSIKHLLLCSTGSLQWIHCYFQFMPWLKIINQCDISDMPSESEWVDVCAGWRYELQRKGMEGWMSCSFDANFSHDWQMRRIHGSVCLPQPVRKAILTNRVTAEASNQRQTAHGWSMDTSLT